MKHDFYHFESSEDYLRFEFESVSLDRRIRKAVEFTQIPNNNEIWNLGFGDIQEDGTIDDLVVSNNGDMDKILATVIQTIIYFFTHRPKETVLFLGSTQSRTRLYKIVISKNINSISELFVVRGILNEEIIDFVPELNYEAFLINLKSKK
jgi:hypothetical protein